MEPGTLSLAQQRRIKRVIPDAEKDVTYWEKRKRNNIAAKKSRENKRQYESMVKGRIHNLEEENALLRKELEVIKEQFNIPKDVCFLSQSQRDECIEANWKSHNVSQNESQDVSIRSPKTILNSEEIPNGVNLSSLRDDNEALRSDKAAAAGPVEFNEVANNSVWAVTPAHSRSLQYFAESSKIYRDEVDCNQATSHTGSSISRKRKHELSSFDDNLQPADLSTKKNLDSASKSTELLNLDSQEDAKSLYDKTKRARASFEENDGYLSTNVLLNLDSREDAKSLYDKTKRARASFEENDGYLSTNVTSVDSNRNPHSLSSTISEEYFSNDDHEDVSVIDLTDSDPLTDSDIKNKLQLLSDQVQRMQKLVCKPSSEF